MKMIEIINEATTGPAALQVIASGKFQWVLPDGTAVSPAFNTRYLATSWAAKPGNNALINPPGSTTSTTTTTTTSSVLPTVGRIAKGVGHVALGTLSGIGKTVAAPIGGMAQGFMTGLHGGKFGKKEWRPQNSKLTDVSTTNEPVGGQAGSTELAQLQAVIAAMNERLRKAGI